MEWIQAHVIELAAFAGAVLAIWNLVARIDKALIGHLDDKFASKHDSDRLEKKVDTMMVAVIRRSHRSRESQE